MTLEPLFLTATPFWLAIAGQYTANWTIGALKIYVYERLQ